VTKRDESTVKESELMPRILNLKQWESAERLRLELEKITDEEQRKILKSAVADLLKSLVPPVELNRERRPESDKPATPGAQYEERIKHLVNWLRDKTRLEPTE
jgi:hypothetical protein